MTTKTIYPKERPSCQPSPRSAPPHDPAGHIRALATPKTPSVPWQLRPSRQRQRAEALVASLVIIALLAICVTALLTVPIITG